MPTLAFPRPFVVEPTLRDSVMRLEDADQTLIGTAILVDAALQGLLDVEGDGPPADRTLVAGRRPGVHEFNSSAMVWSLVHHAAAPATVGEWLARAPEFADFGGPSIFDFATEPDQSVSGILGARAGHEDDCALAVLLHRTGALQHEPTPEEDRRLVQARGSVAEAAGVILDALAAA